MKSLDEVIKANECCDHGELDSRCEDCPYNGVGACCAERESDALHYLKYLQKYYEMCETSQKLRNTSQITCPKCHSEFVILPESNEPLTWDELTQMDMQPVWYESLYWGIKVWAIVLVQKEEIYIDWYHRCQDGEIIKGNRCEIHKDQQGERWQAYRKKRG